MFNMAASKQQQKQLAGRLPSGEPKLILAYLLETICILSLYCICNINCEEPGEINNVRILAEDSKNLLQPSPPNGNSGPRDYAYSPASSRVRDLASFFELKAREANYESLEVHQQQDVIISLSEAASKLHILSAGYPLDFKCNKYVKLIYRPNIRTFATINLLMKEPRAFNEMEQNDANLVAKLSSERAFDAMGKLQTIMQTLESERTNMRSIFEPSVQKDLLDCMNYFIYKHQRATSGLTNYVREQRDKLLPVIAHPVESEILLRKYQELMDETVKLEMGFTKKGDECNPQWVDNLSKLHNLLLEVNQFELPILVQEFVTDKKRLGRLISCNEILQTIRDLDEERLLDIETSSNADATTTTIGSPEEDVEPKVAMEESKNLSEQRSDIRESLHNDETYHSSHEPTDGVVADDKKSSSDSDANDVELPQAQAGIIEPPSQRADLDNDDSKFCICGPQAQNLRSLANLRQVNDDYAPVFNVIEKKVVPEPPAATGAYDGNVQASGSEDVEVKGQRELCRKLSIEQEDHLRLTSWRSLEIDRASKLAQSLNRFKIDCMNKENNRLFWPIVSMTKKLSTWCASRLRDSSLTGEDLDRTTLMRVLELLR